MITNIYDQLMRDEALRLKPYRDNSTQIGFEGKPGKLTIGIGRNLDDDGVSEEEAVFLLHNDVAAVTTSLNARLPWVTRLDPVRFAVLLNMGFNMGIADLMGFRQMLPYLQTGDYAKAAGEMADSAWYHQVGARASRLVQQMLTGEWQ